MPVRLRPIHFLCVQGVPAETLAKLLELKADPNGAKRGGGASWPPLGVLCYSGPASRDLVESAQVLLDYKADVNQRCQPEDFGRFLELTCRLYRCCSRKPPAMVEQTSNVSSTALGFSAMFDCEDLAIFLLRARADPEIRNNRGLRPVDVAVGQSMQQLLTARPTAECCVALPELVAARF